MDSTSTTTIQDFFKAFQDAEQTWIQSVQAQIGTSFSSSLVDCSLHYGEFAFVLAGLKPCLLIQLPTPELTTRFYHNVLAPRLLNHPAFKRLSDPSVLGLSCRLITENVRSPEMSLQGYILVWSSTTVRSHPQAALIQRGIDLLSSLGTDDDTNVTAITTSTLSTTATTAEKNSVDKNERIISEEDLAVMLDIPGRLPKTHDEIMRMIEVSYWHQSSLSNSNSNNNMEDLQSTLLTAFAAQPEQIPDIQVHFKRYKNTLQELLNISLKLHVQSMADVA